MRNKGFFARLADLWRGFWGVKLENVEVGQAEAVYHRALAERRRHHEELREAASRLVYLRNKTTERLEQGRRDLELVEQALKRAALADEDLKALALIQKRRELAEAIGRAEADLVKLGTQADAAKAGLAKVAQAIEELKAERAQMLARKAHAEAQLRAQQAFESALAAGAVQDPALENVREAILRLESDAGLGESAGPGEISLAELRREAALADDKQALSTLKLELRGRLLPESPREALRVPVAKAVGVTS